MNCLLPSLHVIVIEDGPLGHVLGQPCRVSEPGRDDPCDAGEEADGEGSHVPEEELARALEGEVHGEGGRKVVEQVAVWHEEGDGAEEEGDRVGGPDPLEDADVGADARRDDEDGPVTEGGEEVGETGDAEEDAHQVEGDGGHGEVPDFNEIWNQ